MRYDPTAVNEGDFYALPGGNGYVGSSLTTNSFETRSRVIECFSRRSDFTSARPVTVIADDLKEPAVRAFVDPLKSPSVAEKVTGNRHCRLPVPWLRPSACKYSTRLREFVK